MRVMPEKYRLSSYEIILTWDCNLRCVYCYECQPDKSTTALRQTNKAPVSAEKIDEIVDFIIDTHDQSAPELHIIFWGGEPFLAFAAIQAFIAKLEQAQAAEKIKKQINYTTTSNLTTLTLEQLQYLQTKPFSVLVSLDGLEAVTDANRGKGTFARVIRNMALLHGLRIPFQIRMTIAPGKAEDFKQNLIFVNNLDRDFWWCMDHTGQPLDSENISANLAVLLDYYRRTPCNRDRTLARYLAKKQNKTHCIDPHTQITIDPEGCLRICSRADWLIGSIADGVTQYDAVKDLPFYSGQPLKACADCAVYACCKGGCIGAHFEQNTGHTADYKLNDSFCKEMFLLQLLQENLTLGRQYLELKEGVAA